MTSPQFTLGIITYNSERTIRETLDSLVGLQGTDVVELRVTDDASTDDTTALVDAWIAQHRHEFWSVETCYFAQNQGVSRAHTETFRSAKGVWGLYLGGDDLMEGPDFFLRLSRSLEGRSEHIFRTRVKEYYPNSGEKVDFLDSYRFLLRLSAQRQFRYLGGTGLPFRSGPGTVFRVDTLRQLDAFGTYNRDFEDWQMFLRFCRSGYRIGFLDVDGVLWRRHPGQHSASAVQRMKLANRVVKLREIIPYLNRLSLFERWKFRNSGRWSQRFNRIYIRYLDVLGRILS